MDDSTAGRNEFGVCDSVGYTLWPHVPHCSCHVGRSVQVQGLSRSWRWSQVAEASLNGMYAMLSAVLTILVGRSSTMDWVGVPCTGR